MDYTDVRGRELLKLIKDGKIVSPVSGNKRIYVDFTCEVNRSTNLVNVSAYSMGCLLDCYFCAAPTRDFISRNPMQFIPPGAFRDVEQTLKYYSPEEAVAMMIAVSEESYVSNLGQYRIKGFDPAVKAKAFMLMGCEPTIGIRHIFGILNEIKNSKYTLMLETNGVILGARTDYAEKLAEYRNNIQVILSIKAGTEAGFRRMTGKSGRLLKHQYAALAALVKHEIPTIVSYMCGPGFGNDQEEADILKRIKETGFKDTQILIRQDYIPFFVSEYKRTRQWNIKGVRIS